VPGGRGQRPSAGPGSPAGGLLDVVGVVLLNTPGTGKGGGGEAEARTDVLGAPVS